VVAAGAEYEEDPIDLDPSQPDAGAAAGVHAVASHTLAKILLDCYADSAAGTSQYSHWSIARSCRPDAHTTVRFSACGCHAGTLPSVRPILLWQLLRRRSGG